MSSGATHRTLQRFVIKFIGVVVPWRLQSDADRHLRILIQTRSRNAILRSTDIACSAALNRHAAFIGARQRHHAITNTFCFFLTHLLHLVFLRLCGGLSYLTRCVNDIDAIKTRRAGTMRDRAHTRLAFCHQRKNHPCANRAHHKSRCSYSRKFLCIRLISHIFHWPNLAVLNFEEQLTTGIGSCNAVDRWSKNRVPRCRCPSSHL